MKATLYTTSIGDTPLPDLYVVPDNVIDLDAYRDMRTKEGTWPPPEGEVRDYWSGQRGMGVRAVLKPHPPLVIPPRPPGNGPSGAA